MLHLKPRKFNKLKQFQMGKILCCYESLTTPIVFLANAINCHKCYSTKGFEDCAANEKMIACSSGFKCGKFHIEVKVEGVPVATYAKDCFSSTLCNKDDCSTVLKDPSSNISQCEVSCCRGDLCNGDKNRTPRNRVKCYGCLSTSGWDECDSNRKVILCPPGARCGTTYLEGKLRGNVSVSQYAKGCSTAKVCKSRCKASIHDPEIKVTKCKMNCCKEHLCNGKKKPTPTPRHHLKCFSCYSGKSWEDCARDLQVTSCPIGFDRCLTASEVGKSANVSVSVYQKGCASVFVCDGVDKIVVRKKSKLKVKCCKRNLCNGVD